MNRREGLMYVLVDVSPEALRQSRKLSPSDMSDGGADDMEIGAASCLEFGYGRLEGGDPR